MAWHAAKLGRISLQFFRAWMRGIGTMPFLPAAQLDLCADIHWGYLLDLDLWKVADF